MASPRKAGAVGTPLTRGEIIGGFLYWPFYVIGLNFLLQIVFALLNLPLDEMRLNVCFFLINFLAVALIFRRFLIGSLSGAGRHFWLLLQSAVLGFAFYYAMLLALSLALDFLGLGVSNPNDAAIAELAGSHYRLLVACTVLLAPLAEEVLNRGLIFGCLHPKSRFLAYAVSAVVFAALHVWQYAVSDGWRTVLLCAVDYLPAGIALGWTYEKSDTIWAPILVHCLINAVTMGLLRALP